MAALHTTYSFSEYVNHCYPRLLNPGTFLYPDAGADRQLFLSNEDGIHFLKMMYFCQHGDRDDPAAPSTWQEITWYSSEDITFVNFCRLVRVYKCYTFQSDGIEDEYLEYRGE